jgi:hypothetical protein
LAPTADREEAWRFVLHEQGLPTDFNGWSELIVKYLSYVEEISPFKVGQIQKLISDVSKDS